MKKIIIKIIILIILVIILLIIKTNLKDRLFQKDSDMHDLKTENAEGVYPVIKSNETVYQIVQRPDKTALSEISGGPMYFSNKMAVKKDSAYLIGTGKEAYSITGHYQEYTMQYFVSPNHPRFVTCKGFEIIGGDQYFISEYNRYIPKINGKTIINLDYIGLDTNPALLKSIYSIGTIRENENILFNVRVNPIPDRQVIPCDNFGLYIDPINGDSRNIHDITGYYAPYKRTMYPMDYNPETDPEPQVAICDAFTVTGGDTEFLSTYEARNYSSPYMNGKNNTLNINIENLSPRQYAILSKSNSGLPIALSVKEREPGGSGCEMNCCRGPVDLISVKE